MNDRLSPILVKELRQGMRTHLFTIAFILFISTLFGAGVHAGENDQQAAVATALDREVLRRGVALLTRVEPPGKWQCERR